MFYGFFYVSLGKYIAGVKFKERKWAGWLIVGLALLALESSIGVLKLHVTNTILWLTTPIPVFVFFMLARKTSVKCSTIRARKVSSMMYFSHFFWIFIFKAIKLDEGILLFAAVTSTTMCLSYGAVRLSERYKALSRLF